MKKRKSISETVVTIVGLGVIGGSFAYSLRNIGVREILGVDTDEKTLLKAKERQIITEGFTHPKEALKKSDLVIISLYPEIMKSFISKYIDNFKDGAIITDVTGIKGKIMKNLKPILEKSGKNIDFIFGHPMAGREKRGIDFADSEVFKNANYILIKNESNKRENLEFLTEIIKNIGFKNISLLSEKEHDEIIAFTSQLTHAIAVALVNSDNQKYDIDKFIGDSYRDLTRIAKINEDLWSELFMGNKENLLKKIEQFESELDKIKYALESGNMDILKEKFITSTLRREKID
ncbi:prephenate dehydrogenase [Leptotrichia sp. OH3620_COT-345]|uniref:prephenate dehydrogenase n=1 Tax=Leptotrichia sp. OH3620_COT-345 TaxID=2491048 RepID=UPI000F64A5E7|nr:prephenate dehydrogenase [Leptotrichia sp. OH3620_COT-345]RRD40464.1 prephenate dehydrogenase [Leptotrichia sp. OH3620_COT-345]